MKHWIIGFGMALLSACAVDTAPQAQPAESTAESDVTVSPGAQPAAACTPGASHLCCPFANGCSCPGVKDCDANGQWGACEGAGPNNQPCP
jgi:hypothetical protein